MTADAAQRKAVRLYGYRGATVTPNPGALSPVYEVGRLYYLPNGGARFVRQGSGPSWRIAFESAKRR